MRPESDDAEAAHRRPKRRIPPEEWIIEPANEAHWMDRARLPFPPPPKMPEATQDD